MTQFTLRSKQCRVQELKVSVYTLLLWSSRLFFFFFCPDFWIYIRRLGFRRIWEDHNNLPVSLEILGSGTGQDFIYIMVQGRLQSTIYREIGYWVLHYGRAGRRMLTVGRQAGRDRQRRLKLAMADEQKIECGTPAAYKPGTCTGFLQGYGWMDW